MKSNQEKESYNSPFTFYEKFDLYNGVKQGQIIPNYTTYFASRKIINKRETFLNLSYMKHRQLFKKHTHFFTSLVLSRIMYKRQEQSLQLIGFYFMICTVSNIEIQDDLYTRSPYKNTKEKYTSELPSDCTQYYKFYNMIYEGDDDIYQDAIKESCGN